MSAQLMQSDPKVILEVNDLRMHFPIVKGFLRRTVGYVKAVDKVNLFVQKGETLGLVLRREASRASRIKIPNFFARKVIWACISIIPQRSLCELTKEWFL